MITEKSKLRDILANPIGHDIIARILLQLGLEEKILKNGIISNLNIVQIKKLTKKLLNDSFWDSFLTLMNTETAVPLSDDCSIQKAWWKEAVFYQIYPRSFCDSNTDGIGDLPGIIAHLDYLKGLGIDAIWLSPIYDSPLDDNGYDIRNYYDILSQFGTMEDFDQLLDEIHARGMRLIMDLVVNHTSDEHPWFVDAISSKDSPYQDYYLFADQPNNWTSFFSGSAWNYYDSIEKYGLHLFSKKQMDLNWENPKLREDICSMIRWWLAKGVDGFRMDVVNYISKTPGLPKGDEGVGNMMGYYGIEHYFYGPRLHEYLHQLKKEAFEPYQAFTVGETPGVGMEMAKLLTGDTREELDMIFSFDHLENPGKVRFDDYKYDLNYMKRYFMNWELSYTNHCWPSLFFENHDNPRMISKVTDNTTLYAPLAKLLGGIQILLRGTPFIYQGQEWATPNYPFHDMSEIVDVESINLYQELCEKESKEEAFKTILAGTRDHARIMLDWKVADHQISDSDSTYSFFKQLIALRHTHIDSLVYGDITFVLPKRKNYFAWLRTSEKEVFFVECNLSDKPQKRPHVNYRTQTYLCNYKEITELMQPYEICVYY